METLNRSGEMKTIKRMKKLTEGDYNLRFSNEFFQETDIFIGQVNLVLNQYEAQGQVKENLPNAHIAAHMDFPEDYSCRSQDEVQTAHFSLTQGTLHPVVVHNNHEDSLKHKCIVFISDEPRHDENFVLGVLKELSKFLKEKIP